jgi:muramoyltetrapeptide carboxypeptidase
MKVNSLHPGDLIALIAPSSPFEPNPFFKACSRLEEAGYKLSIGKHILQHKGYLAGTEAQRAEDLIRAISDPAVKAVFCIRGGYGSSRLLPWLPFSILKKNPKIFHGHSDITFLHLAFLNMMGWTTFHGPNLLDFADSPERLTQVLSALAGENGFSWKLKDDNILRHGIASGRVIGGNLTCLAHLLGTPYFPNMEGTLLLIEDCREAVYRLDRILAHLKLAGVIESLAGLVIGYFQDCGKEQDIKQMILDHVKPYRFPVVMKLPFGHGVDNQTIPLGMPFHLNTYERVFKTAQPPFH